MTDMEMLEAMKTMLKPIHLKLEEMDNRISNMENEITNLKYEVRKGFRKTDDEIETLTEALRAKGIIPLPKQM